MRRLALVALVVAGCAAGREPRGPVWAPAGTPRAVRSVEGFDHLCREGNGDACADAGVVYLEGHGVRADRGRALDYFQRGCDAGADVACFDLALAWLDGHEHEREAVALLEQLCLRKHPDSCAQRDAARRLP